MAKIMKKPFTDRAITHDRMGILTTASLSDNQETTPEGFLLCKNVPIARTGDQLYTADEIGLEARGDGLVKIVREADQVFADQTISSFEGKPVTIDHPDGTDVNPSNWRDLTVGIVQNVRRGETIEDDLLLADLLITDQRGIDAVRNGLKEVSCGYDADYVQIELGLGRQENILGNHVALVERGRAGARCSIRDKDIEMKTKSKQPKWLDKLRAFLKDAETEMAAEEKKTDDEDLEKEDQNGGEGGEDDSKKTDDEGDDPIEARFVALESNQAEIMSQLKALAEAIGGNTATGDSDEDDEDEDQTQDDGEDLTEAKTAETNSDATGKTYDSLRQVIMRAEILAPGIQIPSGDAIRAKGAKDSLMRKALAVVLEKPETKEMVKPLLLGRELGKLTGDSLKTAFNGASELIRAHNNAKGVRSGVTTKDFGKATTAADINAKNRALWGNK